MKSPAFTLVEVLIAVLLIGLALASLLAANVYFTRTNAAGADLSTAEFLVEQIMELTTTLPVIDPETGTAAFGAEEADVTAYDDLDDFDDKTFSPPINAHAQPLNDFAAFSQHVTVQNVSPTNFEQVVADHASNFVRVTVTVYLNSSKLTESAWLRARY